MKAVQGDGPWRGAELVTLLSDVVTRFRGVGITAKEGCGRLPRRGTNDFRTGKSRSATNEALPISFCECLA